eukprot:TRINITY_DN592_c0_g2_i2.p1 TRINITY_DN592_c0_g2~~TRINITY_DN592_c0_g2_i2.p1  ORF type:complete len:385 (+),score=53.18 TRINITY_DN592_c0_g2_i2:77-1231(+)
MKMTAPIMALLGSVAAVLSPEDIHRCGCDGVLEGHQYEFNGPDRQVTSGTICVEAAYMRGPMKFSDLQTVTIKNCGGVVTTSSWHYSISVERCSDVTITGTGEDLSDHPYGFRLGGTLGVGGSTRAVSIDHVEVYRASFAGIMIKTDPSCDPLTWRENLVMDKVIVRDNLIHSTGDGEGMYIGYTFNLRELECDGVQTTVYPHRITNVLISNNVVSDTGADGIQLGQVDGNCIVEGNVISRFGKRPFSPSYQQNGFQMNGRNAIVRNNTIVDGAGSGNGMIVFGDNHIVEKNTIIRPGANGIFTDSRPVPTAPGEGGLAQQLVSNTIIDAPEFGIKMYHRLTSTTASVIGNVIITRDTDTGDKGIYVHSDSSANLVNNHIISRY